MSIAALFGPFGRGSGRLGRPATLAGPVLSPVILFFWLSETDPSGLPFGLHAIVLVVVSAMPLTAAVRAPYLALGALALDVLLVEFPLASRLTELPWFQNEVHIVQLVAIALLIAFITALREPRESILTSAVVLVGQLALLPLDLANLELRVTQTVFAMLCAWLIGNAVRQRQREAAARRAAAEADAVQSERLRIARELHDIIAHCVGAVAIQAGMARRVIDERPEAAREALAAIEETSRSTMASLRRMLTTLRRNDPGAKPLTGGSLPGLADLDGLVEHSRGVGLDVTVRHVGNQGPLPNEVDLSAYRIIQEAMTNVVRHAQAHRCEVTVDRSGDQLNLRIRDDGRGGPAGSGYGIVGMRERADALGGELVAGPHPEGGFEVSACLPLR